jgi:hypothetical protein
MRKCLFLLVLAFGLFSLNAEAQKRKSNKPKTVHVKSYKTKKGKKVKAYKRSKPSKRTYYLPEFIRPKEMIA